MKLSDQEQVILKAIGSGVAEISRVIRSVGYPKVTVKKVLVGLSEKGVVSLHRHDWPQSLKPEQRKLMVRIGRDYYGAVSVRKRNPKKKVSYARWEVVYINPLYVYVKYEPDIMDLAMIKRDAFSALESELGGTAVRQGIAKLKGDPVILSKLPDNVDDVKGAKGWAWIGPGPRRNPKSKGKTALKKTGRALKGFARGALQSGAEILGAGAMALNPDYSYWKVYHIDTKKSPPYDKTFVGSSSFGVTRAEAIEKFKRSHYPGRMKPGTKLTAEKAVISMPAKNPRRKKNKTIIKAKRIDHLDVSKVHNPRKRLKVRNKYIDLVIKGQAKKTPQGWKVGKKTFAQGRGTVNVSSGYYLDKHTGMVYAKRERNKTKKRKRNVSEGFYDASGTFHPIRSSADYSPAAAGETGRKAKRTKSRKKITAKRKASQTARRKRVVASRKAQTRRLAGRSLKKSSGLLKKGRKRNNPSAESIRKEFAGQVNGERDLFFPQGTPSGKLAKLGKLVSITTEEGTIKPVSGSAWLCADTKERLHIGSTSPNPLFDGPKRNFGKVSKVEYESSKPHLGYRGPIIWFHHMGEGGGSRPSLYADGKGGLKFKGGNYRLTKRGIEG